MESNIKKDSNFYPFLHDEKEELKIYQGVMNQKIGKKKLIISKEIRNRLGIINRLFKEKFGENFFQIKPESLKFFESGLKKYLFSPQSEFLNNFPKLKSKINKQRKIKEEKLKEKINMGSLLYLSLSSKYTKSTKHTNMNDKLFQLSKNLTTSMSKDMLSNALYKIKYKDKNKERFNKILSYRNKRYKLQLQHQEKNNNNFNNENNQFPEIILNNDINEDSKNNFKAERYLKTYISRNSALNLKKYETAISHLDNLDNSIKSFSPFSTFCNNNYKSTSNFLKKSKIFQKDFNENVENLNENTKICNKKLIRLINGNRKKDMRIKEENNKEMINLKAILIGKKDKKPKKKINNIIQIKSLIKKAKLDSEGEATINKIRKNELKNFGHYIHIMSDNLALDKVNVLFTKEELKLQGKNFSRDELERLRKKRKKELIVFNSRKKTKDNYYKILRLENDLTSIKDKFEKTNNKAILNSMKDKQLMSY